jgi:hypothetical protein
MNSDLTWYMNDHGPIRKSDGDFAVTSKEKANELSKFFSSVCTVDNGIVHEYSDKVHSDECLSNIVFTPAKVLLAIKRLKNSASAGPDNLPPIFYKKLQFKLCLPLCDMFNQLLSSEAVPNEWRCAFITAIFKEGISSESNNYRPISPTSVGCKLMENILKCDMLDYLLKHKLISQHQLGFLSKHSAQLLECVNDWTLNIKNKRSTDIIHVDFAKAFDSVCHSKLLVKLRVSGFRGQYDFALFSYA